MENLSFIGYWDFIKKFIMILLIISLFIRIIYWREKYKFLGKC